MRGGYYFFVLTYQESLTWSGNWAYTCMLTLGVTSVGHFIHFSSLLLKDHVNKPNVINTACQMQTCYNSLLGEHSFPEMLWEGLHSLPTLSNLDPLKLSWLTSEPRWEDGCNSLFSHFRRSYCSQPKTENRTSQETSVKTTDMSACHSYIHPAKIWFWNQSTKQSNNTISL